MTQEDRVTAILKEAGLIDLAFLTDEGRDRGSGVHLAIKLLCNDDLAMDSLDPRVAPYVNAWIRARDELQFEPMWIERHMTSDLGYHGTPDFAGHYNGLFCIIDWKTGAYQRYHGIQLAAYAGFYADQCRFPKRYGLYLKSNRTYKLHEFKELTDYDAWRACLALHHWKGER